MKKILYLLFFVANTIITDGQGFSSLQQDTNPSLTFNNFYLPQDNGYPISRFALSVNPLGFVFVGPTINAEFGLTKNLVLDAHARFPSLGLLSYATTEWPDRMTGMAGGGGIIYFFGEKRSKPYVGIIADYQKTNDFWENSSEVDKIFILGFNGGYRFRFDSGFFINTGALFGFGVSHWIWTGSYTEEDTEVHPGGMAEVALGFEF